MGVYFKNPIKNSCQDGLGRTTQTLDYVVVEVGKVNDIRNVIVTK